MKYGCDAPFYAALSKREEDPTSDKVGLTLGSAATTFNSTADAVKACIEICGPGNWKRLWKKTYGGPYDKQEYRVMENKDNGQVITLFETRSDAYDGDYRVFAYDWNLKAHEATIDAVMAFCIKHYIEVDGGSVMLNPKTNEVFMEWSDCGCMYVNDTATLTHEFIEDFEENGTDEHQDWPDDPTKWIENNIPAITESYYGDEWRPAELEGFVLIGRFKQVGDFEPQQDPMTEEEIVEKIAEAAGKPIDEMDQGDLVAAINKLNGVEPEADVTAEVAELLELWNEFAEASGKGPEEAVKKLGYDDPSTAKYKRLTELCDKIGKDGVNSVYSQTEYGVQKTPVPVSFS